MAVLDGYAKFIVGPRGGFRKDTLYTWIRNGEEGMSLAGCGRFHATMMFQVIDCDPATSEGDQLGLDVIRYHWHPRGEGRNLHPHIHALPDLDAHFYLPRATFEDAIHACAAMGAPLTVDPAEATRHLAMTEAPHMLYRTWSDWPPGQSEPYRTAAPPSSE